MLRTAPNFSNSTNRVPAHGSRHATHHSPATASCCGEALRVDYRSNKPHSWTPAGLFARPEHPILCIYWRQMLTPLNCLFSCCGVLHGKEMLTNKSFKFLFLLKADMPLNSKRGSVTLCSLLKVVLTHELRRRDAKEKFVTRRTKFLFCSTLVINSPSPKPVSTSILIDLKKGQP